MDRIKKENKKTEQLKPFVRENKGKKMTTNEGVMISNDENSLTAGDRGPTLLEDFIMKDKMAHFDRERIPERVVHARGYGAHGVFRVYESLEDLTMAHFLQDPNIETPVFVRFSEVAGSKGANETNRDVRGFATKFYTEEGNFDLVGNNIPIFFIQDGIKFPDLIHALKPEPHNEIPQGQTAHDTFWDFIGSNEESAAMMMWIMSDRTLPRSFRMMEGFGVHTFRLVNKEGTSRFVKFHWKPALGVHSLIWDEAQKLGGADPDYHRRDLWGNIEDGFFAEFELGLQVIEEKDEFMFDFDILDATKLWPEEIVPVRKVGKMTLNRNVDNVFAETEQVAVHPGNIVRGIDFTNDPLLQSRIFSYTDTQIYRVGTNFQQIPINSPVCPFHNNQRDGAARYIIDKDRVAYHKNNLADNTPYTVPGTKGGFVTYPSTVEGLKVRETAPSFKDHFSQARLFWNSMTNVERNHIFSAFCFELGKVKSVSVRQRVVNLIGYISTDLAVLVAKDLGVEVPKVEESQIKASSPALSMANTKFYTDSLKTGILIAEQFDSHVVGNLLDQLTAAKLKPVIVSERLGVVNGTDGKELTVDDSFLTGSPLLYDNLFVASGRGASEYFNQKAKSFIIEQYNHFKPLGASRSGMYLMQEVGIINKPGVTINQDQFQPFINNARKQRFWDRS
ncbi:catalase [Cytobacillus purgationiresistens]|uniref:Catalase n=1 Tax=Cytobacillus purgationiresistens TaxID=863449 RepID=A0ABU0AG51_9BACI|nr:catalase [Cytobacillus purgationiresistens]MDQ0269706.1 catalase [Cytobacillus purgationiresistens]